MKKILLAIIVLVVTMHWATAQNCSQFISSANGKTLLYANLDAKGKDMGKFKYTTTRKDASTVAVHSEVFDKNGKSTGTTDSEIKCNGDAISVDMKSFIPANSSKQFSNMQMQGDAKYLSYPLNLKAGQTLDDGSVDIVVTNNGSQAGDIQMDISNRKVEQQETVSTKAGDFDCFRISYDATVKIKMMGIGFPVHMHVTEWFSVKLARPIKSETYTKNGKLAASMQLEAIN